MTWGQGAGWQGSAWHQSLWFGPSAGVDVPAQPPRFGGASSGGGQLSLSEYLERFGPPPATLPGAPAEPSAVEAAIEGDEDLVLLAAWIAWFED